MFKVIKNYRLELGLSILFLAIYLPISLKVDFYQNDDWYYYKTVEKFLVGEFKMLNDIGTSFYAQGFLASIFALLFGLKAIPFLTLFVSTFDVLLFLLILKVNKVKTSLVIISYLIFISFPVFSYSVLGFMTENYILFTVLVSILFFNLFLTQKKNYYFIISLFFVIVGFLIKQNVFVLFINYSIFLGIAKDYKRSSISAFLFVLVYLFYLFLFPQTIYMKGMRLSLLPLTPTNIVFFGYTTLAYILVISLPLFAYFNFKFRIFHDKKFIYKVLLLTGLFICFYFLYSLYSQFKLYPYFGNTFAHLGYLYGSIDGDKPVGRGMSRLFIFYTGLAPYLISFFLTFVILNVQKILKNKLSLFYFLGFVLFHGASLVLLKYFDRYLAIPFVLFLLSLVNLVKDVKISKIVAFFTFPFLLINLYITILFSWDFVLTNSYVWGQSEKLVKEKKVLPEDIYGNGAWIEKYHNKSISVSKYIFFYSPILSDEYKDNYNLVDTKEIKELNPFFEKVMIYTFKRNN